MDIHETGYAWRFIRGSMTLVGLLPPLCDNGNMHVDGGYGKTNSSGERVEADGICSRQLARLDDVFYGL